MKQKLFKVIALLIFTGSVACGWLWMDFKGFMNNSASIPQEGIKIDINKGASLASISRKLYQKGILRSAFYPRLAGKLNPDLTRIKQGEYHLESNLTPLEIFTKLVKGDVISYQIRFIEGWTFSEYLGALTSETGLIQTIDEQSQQQILDTLQLGYQSPEGLFYPDTYNYHKGTSDIQILKMSHGLMQQKMDQYWAERDLDLPYESPYEMLIMASIIEKEAGMASERARIAGVFVRRLNKNMRLQTDPTVIYGMGSDFDGNLRKRDLKKLTPFNTYLNKGLPPTPIAMPSEASLQAAAPGSIITILKPPWWGRSRHNLTKDLI